METIRTERRRPNTPETPLKPLGPAIGAPSQTSRDIRRPLQKSASLGQDADHRPRWEPSWEPFAVDRCGRLWTARDSEPVGSGRYGRLRTPMDGLRQSTDQKVGDSSSSGGATKALYGKGFVARPLMDRMTFGSHSGSHPLHCDPNRGTATRPLSFLHVRALGDFRSPCFATSDCSFG